MWEHNRWHKRDAERLARSPTWEDAFHAAEPACVIAWVYPLDPVFYIPDARAAEHVLPAVRLAMDMGVNGDWFRLAADCDLADRAARCWTARGGGALESHLAELRKLLDERPRCPVLTRYRTLLCTWGGPREGVLWGLPPKGGS